MAQSNNKTNPPVSEVFLKTLLETAVDSIITIDSRGYIWTFNPAAEKMFGYRADEVIGRNINIIMPEPDRSAHDGYLEKYQKTGVAKVIGLGREVKAQRKDGSTFYADLSVSEMEVKGRRIFAGIIHDVSHKKKIEDDLRKSGDRLNQFFEGSSEALFIYDNGIIIDINPAVTHILGYEPEDIIGKHLLGIVVPEVEKHAITRLVEFVFPEVPKSGVADEEGSSDIITEIGVLKKDGSKIPVEFRGKTLKYESKNVRAVGLHDISERKEAEQALRHSEARIRAIVDTVADGIITINAKGIIETFNPASEVIFGYTMDEMVGKNVNILMPEPHHSNHNSYLSHYLEGGDAGIIGIGVREVIGKRKDGSTFPMEISVEQMEISGKPMFTGVVRDITERKMAEQALKASEARLSFLFAESPVVTYNSEAYGNFACTFISDNVTELFGYEPNKFLDDPGFWINGIHPDDLQNVKEGLEVLFEQGSHTHVYRFRHKDGSYCWVEDGLRLISDEEGKPKEIVGYWMNINERKRSEAALIDAMNEAEKANQAKSNFLSSMSHELRTPLNAILGFSQTLGYDRNLSAKQKEHAHDIYKSGTHLLGLVDEVLDLAKIEAGHVELLMDNLVLTDVLDACKGLIESLIKSKGLSFEYDSQQCHNMYVHADYTRLKQVLLNLLSNAAKYNSVNGSVTIHCEEVGDEKIRISVSDTGPGISEDKRVNLFQPFNRLGAEFSGIEGTGIGLVITRQLVEMMRGEIGVDSIPGEGSRFWVELQRYTGDRPIRQHEDIEVAPVHPGIQVLEDGVSHPGLILVAEDNVTNQSVLREQMNLLHYKVDIASNGHLAWEQYQAGHYDLLLTDINMPVMDGFQLLKVIREAEEDSGNHIPVIAFTANAMESEIQRCLDAGMDDFIAKPVNLTDLSQVLDKWMPREQAETTRNDPDENDVQDTQKSFVNHDYDPIDISILSKMVGEDPKMHRYLLNEFVDSASATICEMHDAYANRVALDIAEAAHKLKSSAGAMGASKLAEICRILEAAGKVDEWDEIDALVHELDDLMKSITSYVHNI